MSERPTPETDSHWQELCSKFSWYYIAKSIKSHCQEKERERDEAKENLRILAGLLAYGLGQSGEEWSLDAMRQATAAIAKSLEAVK